MTSTRDGATHHNVSPTALGGQHPTHTGQALALRTADHAHERYLDS